MRVLGNPAIVLPTHWDRFNLPCELGQPQSALRSVQQAIEPVDRHCVKRRPTNSNTWFARNRDEVAAS
jgi:hypothetical protein